MPDVPPAAARVYEPLPESERAPEPPTTTCNHAHPSGPEIETCC